MSLVKPDEACAPAPPISAEAARFDMSMNPHRVIKAPEKYSGDMEQVLTDFDQHCHEGVTLDGSAFNASAPVHALNEREQQDFRMSRGVKNSPDAAKFAGAPGLYAFSEVYFNLNHTVVIVYATHWCGGLCGEGFWVVLTLENGRWVPHENWSSSRWIS